MAMKMPKLKADNIALHSLYHNNVLIDTGDIKDTFKVCNQTAVKVVLAVKEYMADSIEGYEKPLKHVVPVKYLFELYGWDIGQINRSVKVLRSMN